MSVQTAPGCPLRSAMGRVPPPVRHFALASAAFLAFAAALFHGRARLMGFDVDARWALGQSHKIFPFLVWRAAYGSRESPDAVTTQTCIKARTASPAIEARLVGAAASGDMLARLP